MEDFLLFLDSISCNYYINLASGPEFSFDFSRHHDGKVDVRSLKRISAPYISSKIDL